MPIPTNEREEAGSLLDGTGPVDREKRVWRAKEQTYLKQLHDVCLRTSKEYMDLYKRTHRKQTQLRIPAIVMSSFSGVASFGSGTFPSNAQRYVSIVVGIINVSIAMIQTYESYLKVGDIVAKSLTVATSLKKLADDIYTEIFVPVEDRTDDGIIFLRECFHKYQATMDQAPPIHEETDSQDVEAKKLQEKIKHTLHKHDYAVVEGERTEFGKTFRPTIAADDYQLPPNHVYGQDMTHGESRIVVGR